MMRYLPCRAANLVGKQPVGLGVLLVPALAGYLFLNWFNGTRHSLPRETGYHVVFPAAIVGVFLFFIARLCVLFANALSPRE